MEKIYKGMPNASEAIQDNFSAIQNSFSELEGKYPEFGGNSSGSYVRFSSGLQVCWFSGTTSFSSYASAGSLYYTDDGKKWVYPKPFIEPPAVSVDTSTAGSWGTIRYSPTEEGVGYNITSVKTGITGSKHVSLIAIGKWKETE